MLVDQVRMLGLVVEDFVWPWGLLVGERRDRWLLVL